MASFEYFVGLGISLDLKGADLFEFATKRVKEVSEIADIALQRQQIKAQTEKIKAERLKCKEKEKAETEKIRADIEKLNAIDAEADPVKFVEMADLYFRVRKEQLDAEHVRKEQTIKTSELDLLHKQQQPNTDSEIATARVEIIGLKEAEINKKEEGEQATIQDQSIGLDRHQLPLLTDIDCLHSSVHRFQDSMGSAQIPEVQRVARPVVLVTGTLLNTFNKLTLDDCASFQTGRQKEFPSQHEHVTGDKNEGKVVSVPIPKTDKREGALSVQCDVYPGFNPNYFSITAVLSVVSELIQKTMPREIFWDDSCAQVLSQTHKALHIKSWSTLKLLSPDVCISSDALTVVVTPGAVIPQLQDETLHQFLNASRKLTDTETCYSVGMRTALSIYFFIAAFFKDMSFRRWIHHRFMSGRRWIHHGYMSGCRWLWNHQPRVTCWVQHKDRYRMGGFLRWTLFRQTFNHTVMYRSGKRNVLADD